MVKLSQALTVTSQGITRIGGGHSRAHLLPQFSLGPVGGLDLAVHQQVLLGGHVLEEDVVLHAHAQLPADVVDVALHVSAVDLDGTRRRGEESRQERPADGPLLLLTRDENYSNKNEKQNKSWQQELFFPSHFIFFLLDTNSKKKHYFVNYCAFFPHLSRFVLGPNRKKQKQKKHS